MKKRAIGTIALLTITLSALTHGEVKPGYKTTLHAYKPFIKTNVASIDGPHSSLSNTEKSNLSQADGGI